MHLMIVRGCLRVLWVFLCLSVARPAQAQAPVVDLHMDGDSVQLWLQGQPLRDHEVEFSADLRRWEPLLSLRLPSASFEWIDPLASTRPRGFYRLLEWPEAAPQHHADNFRLTDHLGRSRDLYYHSHLSAVVLIFSDGECNASFASALSGVQATFAGQPVLFWMIDSLASSRSHSVERAAAWNLDLPILHDSAQLVARAYAVGRSPEVVAIDTATWSVFYRGTVETYLQDALTSFLAGQPPTFRQTPVAGCPLPLESDGPVSYADQIAPLLIQYCVPCHSEGNIAPFSMTDYLSVAGRSRKINHVILENEMPPWFADPAVGHFANDWSLSPELARTLMAWLDQGAPRGDGPDPLAEFYANTPPPTNYPAAWPAELGEPDLILTIPSQNIPANGEVDYRYLEIRPDIPSDAWLRAAIIRPGNRRIVHHGLVFLGTRFETFLQGAGLNGFFAGYVPGQRPLAFPDGTGKFIPANPTFTFQMHYQTVGTPETDQTELGLYFHDAPPPMEYRTTAASTTSITILPGVREYSRVAFVVPSATQSTLLYELSPHMHYRGWRFEYEAEYPGGEVEKLLSVPNYIFDWQLVYRLAEPKLLPPGTTIRCRGAFDNSPQNPLNPNPAATVEFGEQSDDEMFIGYLNFALPRSQ